MKVSSTPLPGMFLLETEVSEDERGRFSRVFCDQALTDVRPGLHIAQVNHSITRKRGTVRGLHYQQPPMAEAKIIRCLRGSVLDVAVDIRLGSPTFLQWYATELSARSGLQVFIPEGFAHGFQALEDDVELLYLHTCAWSREHEGRLRHDDPRLAIRWPLPVTMLSEADRLAPLVPAEFTGISP